MKVRTSFSLVICYVFAVFGLTPLTASAQSEHVPDVAEFDGRQSYGFPAHDSLTLAAGSTIEFWVAADWATDPGYDPVVLSNVGPQGPLYTVAILGDRAGISLQAGHFVGALPADFSDGDMHHVALADFSDAIAVMVDGAVVGVFETSLPELPSAGLWVGSADGINAPFRGAVAGLRIWAAALEREVIAAFAARDIEDPNNPHPDLEMLVASSDFRDGALQLVALDSLAADDEAVAMTNEGLSQ